MDDPMQCTAQSKRSQQQCRRYATVGMTVCRMHGGKTPVGIAAPAFKTGRYSKYLPARLLERYHEAQTDPTLLDLQAEVALLDTRLADVLSRVDAGESGNLWAQAQAAWRQSQSSDAGEASTGRLTLTLLFTTALADYSAWEEVYKLVQQRQRLVESERKRLVEMQQMITVDRAMLLVAAIIDSVKTHVADPTALAAISQDLLRLTSGTSRDVVDGGRGYVDA